MYFLHDHSLFFGFVYLPIQAVVELPQKIYVFVFRKEMNTEASELLLGDLILQSHSARFYRSKTRDPILKWRDSARGPTFSSNLRNPHQNPEYSQMPPIPPRSFTLRRSCQACVRGKRRCDQRSPKCTRCLNRGLDCEYANAPMAVTKTAQKSIERQHPYKYPQTSIFSGQIQFPLRLEIAKEYDPSVIRFLVKEIREIPKSFARTQKAFFVHPDVHKSGPVMSIREIGWLCKLHVQAEQAKRSQDLSPLLRRKVTEYTRKLSRPLNFEELLGYSQALIIAQCILVMEENGRGKYSEATTAVLEWVAERLWQQAPTQLPSSLSPRHAWLLAESVRRTIIVSLILRSAYSLHTRNYSVRTPFVDALPFDVRTELWDGSEQTWSESDSKSDESMVSLHEYSDAMERGRVYNVSPFAALILAACKGKQISAITFPPDSPYIET